MMKLYGLGGGNRTGKTTMAKYLQEQVETAEHTEFSDVIRDVANRWLDFLPALPAEMDKTELIGAANHWLRYLPVALADVLGVQIDYETFLINESDQTRYRDMHHRLIEYLARIKGKPATEITRANKFEHVAVLQWLGYSTRELITAAIWSSEMHRRITDLQQAEIDLITVGGVRFEQDARLIRDLGGLVIKLARKSISHTHTYATETVADTWPPDIAVINNGTLQQLEKAAAVIVNSPRLPSKVLKTKEL